MFTGVVEELGRVRDLQRGPSAGAITVDCDAVLDGTRIGDSVAVDGCCLTVTALHEAPRGFTADLMGETLDRTALGDLAPGAHVNLERPLAVAGRLDGHLVQGHVDAVARITGVEDRGAWTWMAFALPDPVAPYVAEKGSVAVDGVSLTVTAVDEGTFAVGLIPHTLEVTTLGRKRAGDRVNLEADVVAKYVARLLSHRPEGT